MANPSHITQVTETADVTTDTAYVRSFTLTAGAATASADLRAGGSGGTIVASLSAVANTSTVAELHEAQLADGVHLTLAGSGAVATVAWV